MSNRHSLALETLALDSPPLSQLAENLMLCALEAERAGENVAECPACLLISTHIMFGTNLDVMHTNYGSMVASCEINSTYAHPGQLELH